MPADSVAGVTSLQVAAFLLYPHIQRDDLSHVSSYRALTSFITALPSCPSHLPKSLPPNKSHGGLRLPYMNLESGESPHIFSPQHDLLTF